VCDLTGQGEEEAKDQELEGQVQDEASGEGPIGKAKHMEEVRRQEGHQEEGRLHDRYALPSLLSSHLFFTLLCITACC
jgi:hypothetical protein